MPDHEHTIRARFAESADTARALQDGDHVAELAALAEAMIAAYRDGGKAIFFGNGGSAAEAQHLAAEFLGRYLKDRGGLPSVALADSSAAVTAIGNDYGYDQIFARQVEAVGRPGDVAVGMSTSGRSQNVAEGLRRARELGLVTAAMTGAAGGFDGLCDHILRAPSDHTSRIQEAHLLIGHTLCELVEEELFG